MKRKRYSDEQIAFALRQAENGILVEEVCRKLGVSEATFYRWKKQFAGMGVVENHKRIYRLYNEEGLSIRCLGVSGHGAIEPAGRRSSHQMMFGRWTSCPTRYSTVARFAC